MRLLGIPEVEAIGEAQRLGAGAGQVGGALADRLGRPDVGIGRDATPVAVDRGRERPAGVEAVVRKPEHGCVALLGSADGPAADDEVVLLERPATARDVARRKQRSECLAGIDAVGEDGAG